LVHSTLVPCGQNSITCAPVRETNILNKVHGGLLGYDAVMLHCFRGTYCLHLQP
jgi:hypothetical protein